MNLSGLAWSLQKLESISRSLLEVFLEVLLGFFWLNDTGLSCMGAISRNSFSYSFPEDPSKCNSCLSGLD